MSIGKLLGLNLQSVSTLGYCPKVVDGNTNPIQATKGLAARIEAIPYERSPESRTADLGQKLYCLG